MNYSYWEKQIHSVACDYTVVGAGLVGSSIALALSRKYPESTIQIVDANATPQGASTKNAGFICTGSSSELLATISDIGLDRTAALVERRWKGGLLLSRFLAEARSPVKRVQGLEAFTPDLNKLLGESLENQDLLNTLMKDCSGVDRYFQKIKSAHGFAVGTELIGHESEGQIQPAHVLSILHDALRRQMVRSLFGLRVLSFEKSETAGYIVHTEHGSQLLTKNLIIATNGLANDLTKHETLKPVRNQVIVSQKLDHDIEACIHMDRGYYYFRNVGRRLLAGGGRHVLGDFEKTDVQATTNEALELLLQKAKELFALPMLKAEFQWSGILGVHDRAEPIVRTDQDGVLHVVGLGGMGVAISMQLAQEVTEIL